MGGSPSTSRRSAKIPWSLTRRLSTGRRHQAGSNPPIQPSHTQVMASTRSLSCNCGEARKAWHQGVLGLRVGVGARQSRITELGTSLGRPCWRLSPVILHDPKGLIAQSQDRRKMQHCPICLTSSGPHPVSSLRSAKIWTHVCGGLAALLQEEPGLPVSPQGFSKEGVQAWPRWCGPPILLGCPPLRKCNYPAETPGQEAAAGGCVCPQKPH